MPNTDRDKSFLARHWKKIAAVTAGGTLLAGCAYDASPVLDQKCDSGDVTIVDDTPVAQTSILLANGEKVNIDAKTVKSQGEGKFTVSSDAQSLTDGRVAIEVSAAGPLWNGKKLIALNGSAENTKTRLVMTQNCKDHTLLPPMVSAKSKLSPNRNGTKAALHSYPGFGNRP